MTNEVNCTSARIPVIRVSFLFFPRWQFGLKAGGELLLQAKRKLQGHLNYYAITDNGRECGRYRHQMQKLLYRWLNRRSQRRSYTWERLNAALNWIKWPHVQIKHNLDPFRR